MDELQSKNIDSLFDCAEASNNIFAVVYKIKDRDYSQQDCDTDENSQQ